MPEDGPDPGELPRRAAGAEDVDRVAEFAGLLGEVIRDGLLPNLAAARKNISDPKSPDGNRLKTLNDNARRDLDSVRQSIPSGGKVGDNDRVKAALGVIEELKGKLGE